MYSNEEKYIQMAMVYIWKKITGRLVLNSNIVIVIYYDYKPSF